MKNIILTGMPGTGKTTAGKHISASLGFDFYDTDEILQNIHNRKISEWIKTDEDGFRQAEEKIFERLSKMNHSVIATGGGTILEPSSRLIMRSSMTVWLKTAPGVLAERMRTEMRPLFNPHEDLENQISDLYDSRLPLYADSSLFSIDTGILTVEEVSNVVQQLWNTLFNNNLR